MMMKMKVVHTCNAMRFYLFYSYHPYLLFLVIMSTEFSHFGDFKWDYHSVEIQASFSTRFWDKHLDFHKFTSSTFSFRVQLSKVKL